MSQDVLIVGGGLAGLACARTLESAGRSWRLFDAADAVGGRVRTDTVDGFRLDRGFQILLTAYPELTRFVDLRSLDLRSYLAGADVVIDRKRYRVADPWRRPLDVLKTLFAPIGSISDKLGIAKLRSDCQKGSLDDLFRRPETTTLEALRGHGFSERMIERFFRPFYAGVFLERDLTTSSRILEFTFRMFSDGDNAVPADGMEALPRAIAAPLPQDRIHTSRRVAAIAGHPSTAVVLEDGERVEGSAVVVATETDEASRLLGDAGETLTAAAWNGVTALYYDVAEAPVPDPILVLFPADGSEATARPVNNLSVPSLVSPKVAPDGRHLVSVSVVDPAARALDPETLDRAVRAQLASDLGVATDAWRKLREYRIDRALPAQPVGFRDRRTVTLPSVFLCGDHTETSSIQGALFSGRRIAERIVDMEGHA